MALDEKAEIKILFISLAITSANGTDGSFRPSA
jgi:hypothetical protein